MPLQLIAAAAEEAEPALPAAAVGVLSMSAFIFLLLVTFAFRSVGTRHPDTTAGHHHH